MYFLKPVWHPEKQCVWSFWCCYSTQRANHRASAARISDPLQLHVGSWKRWKLFSLELSICWNSSQRSDINVCNAPGHFRVIKWNLLHCSPPGRSLIQYEIKKSFGRAWLNGCFVTLSKAERQMAFGRSPHIKRVWKGTIVKVLEGRLREAFSLCVSVKRSCNPTQFNPDPDRFS